MNNLRFALVDANNFYVSCERIFQPKLWGRPIIVLSNNDGCAIARSNEAKALGIAMGDPLFKIKHLVKKYNIVVLSANFSLYGDISHRLLNILMHNMPEVIAYSIDESFLDLHGISNVETICKSLVKKIYRYIGLPVSIGIGKTKTLAKVANKLAKKHKPTSHMYILHEQQVNLVLSQIKVEDIWGIGRKLTKKLNCMGIYTGLDLKNTDSLEMQKIFNIVVARTVKELQGISCIDVADIATSKKSIMVSRSFGVKQTDLDAISEALATFVTRAAEKLRAQNSLAKSLMITLQTNLLSNIDIKYKNTALVSLDSPTNDTRVFIKQAVKGLKQIFRQGLSYKKVGVLLFDISQATDLQLDLFAHENIEVSDKLMNTVDWINRNCGKSSIKFLSQGVGNSWQMKQNNLSGINLSKLSSLPVVNC